MKKQLLVFTNIFQRIMPCFHKFHNDLSLDNLTFEPTTLIVGTFNPEWPENNDAEWFYGRTQNNSFWNVLPRIYGEESLLNEDVQAWKDFCHRNLIAITDLISCIVDADIDNPQHNLWLGNYGDNNIVNQFNEQIPIDLIGVLENNPSINNIYLTRGVIGADATFWANIWNPVNNQFINKRFRELLTPSGNARFQLGRYNRQNLNNQLNLADFILMRWQEKWHQL
ncbi:MAG: hypothetical protein EOP47_06990 [Sphingobacteriaceae bacterium]|nr:MAG: hypothetical protein EOP47_06990 [Sphingobacteriaceae bacterium]